MTGRREGAIVLFVAGFLLAGAWLTSSARLPLYDGIRLPAQPYRYLQPPAGIQNPGPPTSGSATFDVSNGRWTSQYVSTKERPPQAEVILDDGAVEIPHGAKRITVGVMAVPPPSQPDDGTTDGNVYRVSVVADNGAPVTLRKGKVTVNLRATRIHGAPVIEEYVKNHWVHLQTGQYIGIALYGASARGLGDFVIVHLGPVSRSSPIDPYLPFIVIGALILAVAGITPLALQFIRRRR
jgi:hypothetical protein